jgi:glycosyltransferase involved in cell wall biosynthesis
MQRTDLLHVWSVRAATAARSLPDKPVVVSQCDPVAAAADAKILRTLARSPRFAIVCSCEIVRRRLIEHGVPPETTVLVRPGVDFGLINRTRRGSIRDALGIQDNEFVSIVPEPILREGGQFEATYAVALRRRLHEHHRVIVSGRSREVDRILAFHRGLPIQDAIIATGRRFPFERLVSAADALLMTPRGDAAISAIPWAMAAGTAVIGTAVHAVAEIIANRVNGLLFKQVRGRSMLASMYRLLGAKDDFATCRETGRGQAYEVFGLRRHAEQTMRVYENILAGRPASEGVTDSAAAG